MTHAYHLVAPGSGIPSKAVAAEPHFFPPQEQNGQLPATDIPPPTPQAGGTFATTHWSVVLKAGQNDPNVSAAALEQLCRTYWRPIYAFIRRYRNSTPEDAEDITQAFFEHLFENATLKKATEAKENSAVSFSVRWKNSWPTKLTGSGPGSAAAATNSFPWMRRPGTER